MASVVGGASIYEDDFSRLVAGLRACSSAPAQAAAVATAVEDIAIVSAPIPIPPAARASSHASSSMPSLAASFKPESPSVPVDLRPKPQKQQPSLRFHEAEDAGDAKFVEDWERKIALATSKLDGERGIPNAAAVHAEIQDLRQVFSPEETMLFKVLESGQVLKDDVAREKQTRLLLMFATAAAVGAMSVVFALVKTYL